MRAAVLTALGVAPHPGGVFVYGAPYVPDIAIERWLGKHVGFAWNLVAEK